MDPENDPQGQYLQDPDEPQAPEPSKQDAAYWQRRAEEAERKLKRETRWTEIAGKFPGLQRDDFKNIPPSEWERLAPRLAGATETAEPPSEPSPAAEPTAQVPQQVKDEQARFNATSGGAPVVEEVVGAKEALKRLTDGSWTKAQFDQNTRLLDERRKQ